MCFEYLLNMCVTVLSVCVCVCRVCVCGWGDGGLVCVCGVCVLSVGVVCFR